MRIDDSATLMRTGVKPAYSLESTFIRQENDANSERTIKTGHFSSENSDIEKA